MVEIKRFFVMAAHIPCGDANSDLFDHCRIKVTLPVSKCLPGWHLLQNGVVYDGGDQSAFRINERRG
jgi:hypothetical protein